MAARRLDRMGLPSAACEGLARIGVNTAANLLSASPLQIMLCTDSSMKEARALINVVSERIQAKPKSALEVFQKTTEKKRFLSLGSEDLDAALKGGLLIGCINEICGPPGIGKTQFCMNAALQCVAQTEQSLQYGLSSIPSQSVVYIDTELKFDPNRMVQMAMESYPHMYSGEFSVDAPHQVDRLMKSIQIFRPTSCKQLGELVEQLQTIVISQKVALIVIDSIAALARKDNLDEKEKEAFFIQQSASLKKIAYLCGCVVLATNQVTPQSHFHAAELFGDAIYDEWGVYQPTLGPTWHHCVSLRMTLMSRKMTQEEASTLMSQTAGDASQQQQQQLLLSQNQQRMLQSNVQRFITISKSPLAPPATMAYTITSKGISVGPIIPDFVANPVAATERDR